MAAMSVVQPWHILTLVFCVLAVGAVIAAAVYAVKLAHRKSSEGLDRQQPQ